MLGLVQLHRLQSEAEAAPSRRPVLHCSAGIGRTGTVCTIDVALRALAALADDAGEDDVARALNVRGWVTALRGQRVGMVQTREQYAFAYRAILDEVSKRVGPRACDLQ